MHEVERSLWKVQRLLGQELPGPAEYYRYGTPQEVAADVGEYATGVTLGQPAPDPHRAPRMPSPRDRAPRGRAARRSRPLLPGGAGGGPERLEMAGADAGRRAPPAALRRQKFSALAARFESLPPEMAYPLAGSFVASLIKTYGVSRVAAFFRACGGAGAPRDDAFRAHLRPSLDAGGRRLGGEAAGLRRGSPPPPPSCCASRRDAP